MDKTTTKLTCVFALALFTIAILRIDGCIPWNDNPRTIQVYLFKMVIVTVIFIATSTIIFKKTRHINNTTLKYACVFTFGWVTATVFALDGRKPWNSDPPSLHVYVLKLMMVPVIFTVVDLVMFSNPLTTSATIKRDAFNEAESEKGMIKEEA